MTTQTATDVGLIGHLIRRAGFGAPAAELERLASDGYDALVDGLLHPERVPRVDEDLLERFIADSPDGWSPTRFMFRMINSPRPLEEKMALMWHGVFPAGISKVTNIFMLTAYYEMLRDQGLGNFRDLLRRLSRAPAMLFYLDQQQNHAGDVNENYGRELLELFSMGRGNYTEDDVRACARAFTGWTMGQVFPRYPSGNYGTPFIYREEDHDDGVKTFLGETGRFNGDDVIDIVVRQPATARFVANEIYDFFVSDDPDPAAIETLARAYMDSGYEIREIMRVLFHSDFFKEARFKRVKCPAEIVAGTVRIAGQYTDPLEAGLTELAVATTRMGQQLLNPPTVEGWHTGREWIDSTFLIERVNFAVDTLGNPLNPGVARMIDRIAAGRTSISASELLDACLYEMGALDVKEPTRRVILEEIRGEGDIRCGPSSNREEFEKIAAQTFRLIGASREYQFA